MADRNERGKAIMNAPPPPNIHDRTAGRNVTGSKRRLRVKQAHKQPPPLRETSGMVMMPTPGHVVSESEEARSREVAGSYQHDREDEPSDDGSGEEEEEDAGEYVVQPNPPPPRVLSLKLGRDSRGRYSSVRESSITDRSRRPRRDSSWILREPIPGGPRNPATLGSFCGHVAFNSWSDPNPEHMRSWIKLYERPKAAREFRHMVLTEGVAARVQASGLGVLKECFTTGLDDNLLSAFIERWHPDTNTFHMPFGEISIMLHDVQRYSWDTR
ncbi:uncharacterized protein LOC141638644 [Silene latifolia]|uniref:uncharacterized protein LOC141638644 n=1 Tax=Silene latifolia TaxID=37657 RepID=UPI003D7711A5